MSRMEKFPIVKSSGTLYGEGTSDCALSQREKWIDMLDSLLEVAYRNNWLAPEDLEGKVLMVLVIPHIL